jgi:uncharacterized protein (TIGR03084 family)
MLPQALDFRDESEALFQLIEPLSETELEQATQFKGWTINNVLRHLHMWNWAADTALQDTDKFMAFIDDMNTNIDSGGLRVFEEKRLKGLDGRELLTTWRDFYQEMSGHFEGADPKMRVKWAGPDMSVRSSITARLMETWAHGQEVYDTLGVVRENGDRIKNIAVLGVNTYGWTFATRGQEPPGPAPYVKLTGPSGAVWEWNEPSETSAVVGDATEFCQVVTQVRNIADTSLTVSGPVAEKWMSVAQCFAGAPEEPPAPGSRGPANGHA